MTDTRSLPTDRREVKPGETETSTFEQVSVVEPGSPEASGVGVDHSLVKSLTKKYEAGEPETVAYLEGEYNRLMSLSPNWSDVYPAGSQWA